MKDLLLRYNLILQKFLMSLKLEHFEYMNDNQKRIKRLKFNLKTI